MGNAYSFAALKSLYVIGISILHNRKKHIYTSLKHKTNLETT